MGAFDEAVRAKQAEQIARAFRAGWATGFQECAEGLGLDWNRETEDRPAAETAALERWLFVEAASKAHPDTASKD